MKIIDIHIRDIRFPTSSVFQCSNAMNPDTNYSAAYVVPDTDQPVL